MKSLIVILVAISAMSSAKGAPVLAYPLAPGQVVSGLELIRVLETGLFNSVTCIASGPAVPNVFIGQSEPSFLYRRSCADTVNSSVHTYQARQKALAQCHQYFRNNGVCDAKESVAYSTSFRVTKFKDEKNRLPDEYDEGECVVIATIYPDQIYPRH